MKEVYLKENTKYSVVTKIGRLSSVENTLYFVKEADGHVVFKNDRGGEITFDLSAYNHFQTRKTMDLNGLAGDRSPNLEYPVLVFEATDMDTQSSLSVYAKSRNELVHEPYGSALERIVRNRTLGLYEPPVPLGVKLSKNESNLSLKWNDSKGIEIEPNGDGTAVMSVRGGLDHSVGLDINPGDALNIIRLLKLYVNTEYNNGTDK